MTFDDNPTEEGARAYRFDFDGAVALFGRANTLIGQVRAIRSEQNVKPRQRITMHVPPAVADLVGSVDGAVETLAGVGSVVPLGDDPATALKRVALARPGVGSRGRGRRRSRI